MRILRFGWLVPVMLALSSGSYGLGQTDNAYLRALTTIYSVSKIGGFVKDWCDLRAPQTGDITTKGLAAWRKTFQLDDIEAHFVAAIGNGRAQVDSGLEAQRSKLYTKLDQASQNPTADCQHIENYLNTEVNPQQLYPQEYQLALRPPSNPTTVQPAPINTKPPSSPATNQPTAPQGTVYSVAQLGVLLDAARKAKQSDEKNLSALGRFFVAGTLEKYDPSSDVVFLNTVRDGFRSRISVTCYDLSFNRLYDHQSRALTLQASFHDMTGSSIIELENCEVITNTAGLKAATLDDHLGLRRVTVAANRIMTQPNQGLKPAQIEGMYWDAKGEYTFTGYQFVERTYLLLKDGWLYNHPSFTPADLNVAESRKLEPQHWGKWKRQGKQIVVQWFDDWGKASGKPQTLSATYKAPMKTGTRLSGNFQTSSSYSIGSVSNGTTSTSTTGFTFLKDGTYTYSGYSLTTAMSTVGTGQDGASGAVATGNGGASFGPNGTSASAAGSSTDAGTYSIDGYTLELRSKKGVRRYYAFLWDNQKYSDHLVVNGTTYSIPTKK